MTKQDFAKALIEKGVSEELVIKLLILIWPKINHVLIDVDKEAYMRGHVAGQTTEMKDGWNAALNKAIEIQKEYLPSEYIIETLEELKQP